MMTSNGRFAPLVIGAALACPTTSAIVAGQAMTVSLPPAVEVRVPKPPAVARGDGKDVLVYELHVTNFVGQTLTLKRVEVLDGARGASVATLADSALNAVISRRGVTVPAAERARIGSGLRAIVWMWVPLTPAPAGAAGGTASPRTLRHRLTFESDSGPSKALVAETYSVPATDDIAVIGPPLRGGVWLAANGPSNESGHRRALIPVDGGMFIAQRFAIDYVKVNDQGTTYSGDRLKNSNYLAYGNDALVVADANVVAVKDGIPENVPGATSRAVPITLETVGGNHVILDLGGGRYAFYAHLQPGSIRVHVGDLVKRGQVLGLVGNSGNSTEPHLHFHLSDSNSPLASEGIPYAHESLEVVGKCRGLLEGCASGASSTRQRVMPFANELVRFP